MLVFALSVALSSTEREILAYGFLGASALSVVGLLLYKFTHIVKEAWSKFEPASAAVVDWWFDRELQIARRRAEVETFRRNVHLAK